MNGKEAGMLEYKGYRGSTQYSPEDRVFHGKLLGIRALVAYESDTRAGLQAAFEEAVDNCLGMCEEQRRGTGDA